MMAFLHGLPYAPVARCRVLELGCGDGGHLLPMAAELPGATFVGVDLSSVAIAKGGALAEAAGLSNVTLAVGAVEEYVPAAQFDYIVAHGLYSWVPDEARAAVLRLCGECLADNGIAYVSYNVYPGQKVREIARDFLRMHAGSDVASGLEGLRMAASARSEASFYTLGLTAEWKRLSSAGTHLVAHDALADWHHPVYFKEFAHEALLQGLHFVSEAQFGSLQDSSLQPEARAFLDGLTDPLLREQYRDFFRGVSYRESLLARSAGVLDRERFRELCVGCALHMQGEDFLAENGAKVAVDHPFAREALQLLCGAWPARVRFREVARTAQECDVLTEMVLRMTRPGMLDCDLEPWPFATRVSERPRATALARVQAASGRVASLRHTPVQLDDVEAQKVLTRLDGSSSASPHLERLLRLSLLVE